MCALLTLVFVLSLVSIEAGPIEGYIASLDESDTLTLLKDTMRIGSIDSFMTVFKHCKLTQNLLNNIRAMTIDIIEYRHELNKYMIFNQGYSLLDVKVGRFLLLKGYLTMLPIVNDELYTNSKCVKKGFVLYCDDNNEYIIQ